MHYDGNISGSTSIWDIEVEIYYVYDCLCYDSSGIVRNYRLVGRGVRDLIEQLFAVGLTRRSG